MAVSLALLMSACEKPPTSGGPTPTPANTAAPVKPAEPATPREVTAPSGLKYADLVVGTGASPKAGDLVIVHYTGTLTDGTKFDSSRDRGKPFEFHLQANPPEVIRGWDEGVATMKVGGKRRLTIPPDLAYGSAGRPPVIPPNATLVFEIELLDIKPGGGSGNPDSPDFRGTR